jgi:hypothetical protein
MPVTRTWTRNAETNRKTNILKRTCAAAGLTQLAPLGWAGRRTRGGVDSGQYPGGGCFACGKDRTV